MAAMRARPQTDQQLWDRFTAFAVKINAELSQIDHRIRRLEQRLNKVQKMRSEQDHEWQNEPS